MLNIFKNLFVALVGSYALSNIGLLALRLLIGESWPVVGFFTTFSHLLWLPALVLLPLMLLLRAWAIAGLLLPSVLLFLGFYGGQFWPGRQASPQASDLSALTYNLYAMNSDYARSAALIAEQNAAIVALQELGQSASYALTARLNRLYPHQALYPRPPGYSTQGMGLLSKHPILEKEFWQYDWLPIPLAYMRVVLDVQGRRLVVYNAHPTHPGMSGHGFFDDSLRDREIRELMARIRAEGPGDLLLLGDFNLPDQSDDYQQITATLRDSYREVGWGMGWTYPATLPILRLDYGFYQGNLQATQAQLMPHGGGSDHRPVFFAWRWLTGLVDSSS